MIRREGPEVAERSKRDGGLRILIIAKDFPLFPGGIAIEYLNATNLAKLGHHVGIVSMVHTSEAAHRISDLESHGLKLYLWKSPALSQPEASASAPPWIAALHRKLCDLYLRAQAWPHRPTDSVVADLGLRNMARALTDALTECAWDVFIVVQSSAAGYIGCLPEQVAKVLLMHDVRSVLYQRHSKVARGLWLRRHLRGEARRYYRFERDSARNYDSLIAVSPVDAEWIRRNYRPARVLALPLPVDSLYFSPRPDRPERPNRIVFTGLMSHPPNADGAVFFAREVFPLIRKRVPEAEFFVVGRSPSREVLELAKLPGITVTGAVADSREYLAEAAVVVVPIRFGSGSRYKILEAWCMRKCVVSTSVGAEGLEYRDGVHLAIADDAPKMAACATRALLEPEYRDALRHAGREVATTTHSPVRIAEALDRHLREVVSVSRRSDSPMRIALDMRWMTPGLAGGIENLARSMVNELIALDQHNLYTLILPNVCRYDFDLRSAPNFRIVCPDSFSNLSSDFFWRLKARLRAALRVMDHWESPEIRSLRRLRALGADIAYSFPGYIHPDLYPMRHVLQLPDIQHEFFPEFFSEAALAERRRLYLDAAQRADHICTLSEFSRRTIIERLGVEPDRISAVHLAADSIFQSEDRPATDATLKRLGLSRGTYLYFPAHTWHHKNHRAAIAALRIMRERHRLTPLLVATGGAREAQPALQAQIADSGLEDQVTFLGYRTREEVCALYRGAACLVFPSLFEGFGMPVLEAMASGCPVVCSNTTSLPEIAGTAAALIDPNNPETLAEAIVAIIREPEWRAELVRRGLERASCFSWRRHALETLAILRRVHHKMYRF